MKDAKAAGSLGTEPARFDQAHLVTPGGGTHERPGRFGTQHDTGFDPDHRANGPSPEPADSRTLKTTHHGL